MWGLLYPAKGLCRHVKRRRDPEFPQYLKPRLVGGLDRELETIMTTVKQEKMVTGTGKTLLAESLPSRLGVPLVRVKAMELLSKDPVRTLREKFSKARSLTPVSSKKKTSGRFHSDPIHSSRKGIDYV